MKSFLIIHFNLTQYIPSTIISMGNQHKIINVRFKVLYFTMKANRFGVYCTLTSHLHLDSPHFKPSSTTCG